jgi:hypothetical protein
VRRPRLDCRQPETQDLSRDLTHVKASPKQQRRGYDFCE